MGAWWFGLAAVLVVLGLASGPSAQEAPPPEPAPIVLPESLTPEVIDALVARLSDAEVREALIQVLGERAAAEAAPATAAGPGGLAGLVAGTTDWLAELALQVDYLVMGAELSLNDLPRIVERLSGGQGADAILEALAWVLGIAALAFLAARGLHRATSRQRRRLEDEPPRGYGDRLARSLGRTGLDLLEIALFAVLALGGIVAAAPEPSEDLRLPVMIAGAAAILVWAAVILSRLLFSPRAPAIRLVALDDATALSLHRWLVRIVAVGAVGWAAATILRVIGLGYEVWFLTVAAVGLLVALTLSAAILANRRQVAEALRRPGAGRLRWRFAGIWHVLTVAYVLAIWLVWAVGLLTFGSRRFEAVIASLVILVVLPLLDRLIRAATGGPLPASGPPAPPVRTYRQVFGRALRVLVVAVAALALLRLWGLDLVAATMGDEAGPIGRALFDIVVSLAVGTFAWGLFEVAVERHLAGRGPGPQGAAVSARAQTLVPLLRRAFLAVLVVVVGMICLSALGVDIGPLLASAGVVGIAIGFGAQAVVRDVLSGIFFLVEDAFRVGEYVEAGDKRGTVEAISLRSLRLRHHRGAVHTLPFGELRSVTNHSRDWVIEKLELGLTYDTDVDRVKKILKQIGRDLQADPELGPNILEPLKSQGVHRLGDFSIVVRAKFMAKPGEQFIIRREAYRRIKQAFAENGIHFAFPTVSVQKTDGAEPATPADEAAVAEKLRQLTDRRRDPAAQA